MVMLLVMQTLDNAIALRPSKRWLGRGYRLVTEQNRDKPNPTYIEMGNQAVQWLARHTGGIAQSNVLEALGNIPTTAHVLGGAVIGADAQSGVIDQNLHVFGYQNMLVCDGAAMPANPGVNPALTITALAEYAMAQIPQARNNEGVHERGEAVATKPSSGVFSHPDNQHVASIQIPILLHI